MGFGSRGVRVTLGLGHVGSCHAGLHRAAGWEAYGCRLGCTRLQAVGCFRSLRCTGCRLRCTRLQAADPHLVAERGGGRGAARAAPERDRLDERRGLVALGGCGPREAEIDEFENACDAVEYIKKLALPP